MATNPLNVTSLSNTELKKSLIEFLEAKPEWSNVDYEGSAINTIADLLVYNAQKTGYQANMVANESFLDTAQIRANVVSHAQKLSYTPKSPTAARIICTISVTPPQGVTIEPNIVMEAGTQFIGQSDNNSFTFVNTESYVLTYSQFDNAYKKEDVVLYQGQMITETYTHKPESKIDIQNKNADNSSFLVSVDGVAYNKAESIDQLQRDSNIYFLGESLYQQPQIEFGRNILGIEPPADSSVQIRYIATEDTHANGLSQLIAASPIANYSNITVTVDSPAYGGSGREDIERIKYLAPKLYQSQDRALTDSDYIPLLQSQFPFVRSAISWGGETNNPPAYGTVFVSILVDEGIVTNSIKQQMVSFLSSRNVGSITPTIVDPVQYYADLNISFSYDNRKTNKRFNDLSSDIESIVTNYNQELFDFGQFLNPSEIISRIKKLQGITSVDVTKQVIRKLDVVETRNHVYTATFGNPVKPESLIIEDFEIVTPSTNAKIYDDGVGNVLISYVDSQNKSIIKTIGTIDYQQGDIEFTASIKGNGDIDYTISMNVEPQEDNFYVTQNRVIKINNVNYELIDVKTRKTTIGGS